MSQRTVLRIVYWMVFACIVLATVSPTGLDGLGAPGYFTTYWNDPPMLLVGVALMAVLVWIGLRI